MIFSDIRSILLGSQVLVSIARLHSLFLNPLCRSSANEKAAKLTANQSLGGALYFSPNRPRYIAHDSPLQSPAGMVQWGSNGVGATVQSRPSSNFVSDQLQPCSHPVQSVVADFWTICDVVSVLIKWKSIKVYVLKSEIVRMRWWDIISYK